MKLKLNWSLNFRMIQVIVNIPLNMENSGIFISALRNYNFNNFGVVVSATQGVYICPDSHIIGVT